MSTTSAQGFNDVKGIVAVDQHVPHAGSIVWWRLSGTVDFETIRKAWLAANLEEKYLLSPCSPTVALRRAVDGLREKRRLVRPLGRGAGFAVVKERIDDKKELEYDVLCKITLDDVGRVKVETVGASDDQVASIAAEVRTSFERHLTTLETEDFSSWLVRLMPVLDAVGLRDGGGVYFVPPSSKVLEKIAIVLREVSGHVINRVPAMRSDDAVEAILDAITQEASAEAEALERSLAAGKLGEVGFQNRVDRCDEVESKVTRYEELLGRKLDTVRERLDALRTQLTVAVLKAQSAEDVS